MQQNVSVLFHLLSRLGRLISPAGIAWRVPTPHAYTNISMVLNMGVTVAWEATETAVLSLLNSASTKSTSNPTTTTAAPASLNPASTAGSKTAGSDPTGASDGKGTTRGSFASISTGAKACIGGCGTSYCVWYYFVLQGGPQSGRGGSHIDQRDGNW